MVLKPDEEFDDDDDNEYEYDADDEDDADDNDGYGDGDNMLCALTIFISLGKMVPKNFALELGFCWICFLLGKVVE